MQVITCVTALLQFNTQASLIAEELLAHNPDAVRILFNKFRSAISFKPTIATVLSPDVSDGSQGVSGCKERCRCLSGAGRCV